MEITPEELIRAVREVEPSDYNARFKVLDSPKSPPLRWNGQEVTLPIGSVISALDYGPRQLDMWVKKFGLKLLRLEEPPKKTVEEAKEPEKPSAEATKAEKDNRPPHADEFLCLRCGKIFKTAKALREHERLCRPSAKRGGS